MKLKSLINPLLAAFVLLAAAASCAKSGPEKDTLSVEPSAALSFEAAENADVTLTVSTTADKWEFSAPEWVVAERAGATLVVNVADNAAERSRVGRITFTAGTAEPVKINIHQEGLVPEDDETDDPAAKIAVTLNNEAATDFFTTSSAPVTASVSVSIAEAAAEDIVVEIALDPEYVREYAFINGDSYTAIPSEAVTFASAELTIPAGETESEPVEVSVAATSLGYGEGYLVPLLASVKSGEAAFAMDAKRVNYVIMRSNPRTTKQAVFFEVNQTNPLNALEYNLADGTPFFDVVIIFAANINYDSTNDVVYLHNNPNVQALLDNTETYIQPLRKKGIKVYLGLLGNHDAAGLAQLSDWGAQQFAQEVAETCRTYKLDGVNIDDEYSGAPDLNNPWFTSRSAAAGARLAYELKMAMKEKCYWPTDVSIFEWGAMYSVPGVTIDDVYHPQSEFIDWICANYGSYASPWGDLTSANCSAYSVELNLGRGGIDVQRARNGNYGWGMWFAFHPVDGGLTNNRERAMTMMQQVAQGLYNQNMAQPQNVYKRLGEGKFDPTPYPIN